jgi:ABC-type nickel/cobalt efflux system permease component RcnA
MNLDSFIVTVATGAVAIVLLLGLANMLRGGSANRSQNLMRLRVVLQAVAIVLIVLVLWWRSH